MDNIPDIEVSVFNKGISDHYGQVAIIKGELYVREPKFTQKVRDTTLSNITLLNAFLYKENWDFLT